MPVVPIAAGVVAAATVVGTVATIRSQNRANALAKDQYAYEKQLNQNKSIRERRDAVRAARLTGATITQSANNQGSEGTSAALGAQGSIISQLDNNLSFLDTQKGLTDLAGGASLARQGAQTAAQNWGAVTNLGMQVFSITAGKLK